MNFNLLEKRFKDKKVFIAGITGLTGSWLALILHRLGAEIYGVGRVNFCYNSPFYRANVKNYAKIYYMDIKNLEKYPEVCRIITQCDYVFNLISASNSFHKEKPIEAFSTGLMSNIVIQELLTTSENDSTYVQILNNYDFDSLKNALAKTNKEVNKFYQKEYFTDKKTYTFYVDNVTGGGDYSSNTLLSKIGNSISNHQLLKLTEDECSAKSYNDVVDVCLQILTIISFKDFNNSQLSSLYLDFDHIINIIQSEYELFEYEVVRTQKANNNNKYLDLDFWSNQVSMGMSNFDLGQIRLPEYTRNINDLIKFLVIWYNNIDNEDFDYSEFVFNKIEKALNYYEEKFSTLNRTLEYK